MKNIEEYKNDIKFILKGMAEIEAYLDTASEHRSNGLFESFFGNIIKNDMPELIKRIDKLTETMKKSFMLDCLIVPVEPDKISEVAGVYTSIEFIEHQMKTIKTKHALYYFNCK